MLDRDDTASATPEQTAIVQPAAALTRRCVPHLPIVAVYVCLAVYVMHEFVLAPNARLVSLNVPDQTNFEWMLTAVAHQVIHLHSPMFTPLANAPYGVNLAANPSMPLLGVLLTPLTLTVGASVVFLGLLTFNLAATAGAWYWFFLRHPEPGAATSVRASRLIAAFAGLLCGFSPAMITHTYGHPNLNAQWLIPFIVDRALALPVREKSVRAGATLGLLVAIQAAISEELDFIAVAIIALVLLVEGATHPRRSRAQIAPVLRGLGAAVVVTVPLLAYPLWFQFAGPRSYTGFPWPPAAFSANLPTYAQYPVLSFGGDPAAALPLIPDETEAASFIGWPVLLALGAVALWRCRDSRIWACLVPAAIAVSLSLGPAPMHGHGVWSYVEKLPAFADALPARFALPVFPLLTYVFVVGLHAALRYSWKVCGAVLVCVAALMAPGFPRAVPSEARPATPAFYADGLWRQCVTQGTSLFAYPNTFTAMRWQTATGFQLPIVGGNFFGPSDGSRAFGTVSLRSIGVLLDQADTTGKVPRVTPAVRAEVASDVEFWHASCVALYGIQPYDGDDPVLQHPEADRQLLTELFGPGRLVGGVWTWHTTA